MQIRKAKLEDAEEIAKMAIALGERLGEVDPLFKTIDKAQLREFKKTIKRGIRRKKEFILIAKSNEHIIGFIHCKIRETPEFTVKKRGTIIQVFIRPEYRSKGIGTKLIEAAGKEVKKRKIRHLTIGCTMGNDNAIKLYKRLGFKEFRKELRKTI